MAHFVLCDQQTTSKHLVSAAEELTSFLGAAAGLPDKGNAKGRIGETSTSDDAELRL